MATSSLLGIDVDTLPATHNATGIGSLGPSDASDSGSDSLGAYSDDPDSDTDRHGTGERSSVEPDERPEAQDILPDHIEVADAGNGAAVGTDALADMTDDGEAASAANEVEGASTKSSGGAAGAGTNQH